jgi:hypothetical protein
MLQLYQAKTLLHVWYYCKQTRVPVSIRKLVHFGEFVGRGFPIMDT